MPDLEKRIFVPTDFSKPSEAALQYAVFIANRTNSSIHLVHFADRDLLKEKVESGADYRKKIGKLEKKLEDMKTRSGAAFRISTKLVISDGHIADLIRAYGHEIHAEMACMGTFGSDSRPSRFKMGNNTEKLVRGVDFPVFTCRTKIEPLQFKHLLLPIDLTKYTKEKVERIIRFARNFDSTIHLVAVSEFFEEFISSRSSLEEKMEEAAAYIRKNGLKCTTEMIRTDTVSNSVLMYADEIHADLLVVMTHAENRINQLLFGSRINKVISHAEIPVLSFRPSDEYEG